MSKVKMTPRKILETITLLLKILFFFCLSIAFYLDLRVYPPNEALQLPRGSIRQIVTYLHDQGADLNRLDSYLLRFFGKPQSGWIDLGGSGVQDGLSKGDLLYKITHSKSALKEISLIPGETMYFFFKEIASKFDIKEDLLWQACEQISQCIEGNFVPQTYKIPYGASPKDILNHLLQYSQKMHTQFAQNYGIVYGSKEWKRILSKASIIQKEAGNLEEMPIISAVIENRIQKGMPLQMDGSLNYGKYSHEKVTPKKIREDKSLFNTYKYKGIPPIPSGSASFEALRASLEPAKVEYLYFVRTQNGRHTFSKTYQEHKNNFKN